jgi:hypothetical protein
VSCFWFADLGLLLFFACFGVECIVALVYIRKTHATVWRHKGASGECISLFLPTVRMILV